VWKRNIYFSYKIKNGNVYNVCIYIYSALDDLSNNTIIYYIYIYNYIMYNVGAYLIYNCIILYAFCIRSEKMFCTMLLCKSKSQKYISTNSPIGTFWKPKKGKIMDSENYY